jgi:hypothetical protein
MEQKPDVLLMFLGGSPNSTNIVNHWVTMNRTFDNKDNVFVVVHPKNVDDNISVDFKAIFKAENVFKVDEAHHVETAWATLSLVDALLLMMQYAHSQHSNKLFDKYILLSSTCCPLYRLDIIYDEICKDNKSIMGHHLVDRIQGEFWMILDKRHAEFFFDKETPQSTYQKEATSYECEQIAGRKTKHPYIKIIVDTLDSKIKTKFKSMKDNPCIVHDEYFIIECLYEMIKHTMQDFRFITVLDFKNNLKKIKKIDEFKEIQAIKIQNAKKYFYLPEIFDVKGIQYIPLGEIPLGKLYIYPKLETFNRASGTNLMFIPSTYHHMFYSIEYNPTNVLRDFSFYDLKVSEFLSAKEKLSELQTTISTNMKVFKERQEKGEESVIYGLGKKYILAITTHPIEYDRFTLRSIINTFILLLELSEILLNDKYCDKIGKYQYIFYVYLCILINKFKLLKKFESLKTIKKKCIDFIPIARLIKNSTFVSDLQTEIEKLEEKDIDEKKYGTFITGDILVEAICHGSFFIRKCFDTSLIETYSDVLSKLKYINDYKEDKEDKLEKNIVTNNGLFNPDQLYFKTSSKKSLKTSSKKSLKTSSKKSLKTSFKKSLKTSFKKSLKTSFKKSLKTSFKKSLKTSSKKKPKNVF